MGSSLSRISIKKGSLPVHINPARLPFSYGRFRKKYDICDCASSLVTAEYATYASFLKDSQASIPDFLRNRLKCDFLRTHQ